MNLIKSVKVFNTGKVLDCLFFVTVVLIYEKKTFH